MDDIFMCVYYSLFMAFVFVFPAYLINKGIHGSKKKNEDAVLTAMKRGHVVTAVWKKHLSASVPVPGTKGHRTSAALYEYTYKGKSYRYKFYGDDLPSSLRLYFISNPAKATVKGDLTASKVCWPLVYVIVAAVLYFILSASGIDVL